MTVLDRSILIVAIIGMTGCAGREFTGPMSLELVEVAPDQPWHDLQPIFDQRESLLTGIERSLDWLARKDDSVLLSVDVSAGQVRGSLESLRDFLRTAPNPAAFSAAVRRRFVRYEWIAPSGPVEALFTGYFAPEYRGSLTPSDEYAHPLYPQPDGWSPGAAWHTRREVVEDDLLAGHELVWLADALDAYLIEVNGSGRVRLPDGAAINLGHVGTNNLPYTSLGRLLIDRGLAREDDMSMQTIRRLHEQQPATVESFMLENDRMVFFEVLEDDAWPRSALGLQLVPGVSAAMDLRLHPPAALMLIELDRTDAAPTRAELRLCHDTGGAIVGPGRADLFIGVGPAAGEVAGSLVRRGRITLLLLADETPARDQN